MLARTLCFNYRKSLANGSGNSRATTASRTINQATRQQQSRNQAAVEDEISPIDAEKLQKYQADSLDFYNTLRACKDGYISKHVNDALDNLSDALRLYGPGKDEDEED